MSANILAIILSTAVPLLATRPVLVNGSVQTAASLSQIPANGWVGYTFTASRTMSVCGCRLDSENMNISDDRRGPSEAFLFMKMRDGQATRVRFFTPTCEVDAGGETVTWIENVSPSESISFLRHQVESGSENSKNGALFALSMHNGATDTLIDIARHNPSSHLRGQALFWLSQQAGEKAAAALLDAVDNDPEDSVRAKAVFGIAQLPNDQSIPMLADLLKHHKSREVRKKAAFWLGQKNDPRALDALTDVLRQ
jgi:HEAT repeat protein